MSAEFLVMYDTSRSSSANSCATLNFTFQEIYTKVFQTAR